MIQHGRLFVTLVRTRLRRSRPYLSPKQKTNRHSLVCLSTQLPKERGRSSVHPLPPIADHAARHHSLRRSLASQSHVSLAPSSPIVVGRATDPAMVVGAHVPWCLRSSLAKPRALTSMAGSGGARASPLAAGSHRNDRNRPASAFPFLML